eukprot:CAMPEP_0198572494 /NCGR_PEP_ID=MMETSP1462-20131121/111900_1 /TAXON_ID=1333877 /ORGANISM="Brandtodinium nutriculum, Strain RCC3387" /LENGTH=134 /DNA_ID=CAMNT_0044303653 /DNA_START=59 /DNA_END=460 /DNA_ORIENTATION=+
MWCKSLLNFPHVTRCEYMQSNSSWWARITAHAGAMPPLVMNVRRAWSNGAHVCGHASKHSGDACWIRDTKSNFGSQAPCSTPWTSACTCRAPRCPAWSAHTASLSSSARAATNSTSAANIFGAIGTARRCWHEK